MPEQVSVVTDLPSKRFSANPKVLAGVVIGIIAVGALVAIKAKLNTNAEEPEAIETPAA